jgi:hypothetical protein
MESTKTASRDSCGAGIGGGIATAFREARFAIAVVDTDGAGAVCAKRDFPFPYRQALQASSKSIPPPDSGLLMGICFTGSRR